MKRKIYIIVVTAFILIVLLGGIYIINCKNIEGNLFVVNIDNSFGIIDEAGKYILKPYYHFIDSNYEEYSRVMHFSKWGFIDSKGKIKIPIKYDYVLSFSEGYAAIKQENKWGFINNKGEMVIQPIYDYVSPFRNGIAVVALDNKHLFIDKEGNVLFDKVYAYARNFSEGKAFVQDDKTLITSFIDSNGEELISLNSNVAASDFNESRSIIKYPNINGEIRWKIIDENFKSIYEDLDVVTNYKDGVAFYGVKGIDGIIKWGLIDKDGNKITEANFCDANINSDGYYGASIEVSTNEIKWGFINKQGEFTIDPIYDFVGSFYKEFGIVCESTSEGEKWGVIDISGNNILEIKFDMIYPLFTNQ